MSGSTLVVSTPSVLLVEDDPSLQSSLRDFLIESGWITRVAGTVGDAWRAIRSEPPALCILDVNLPDGSGLDLFRRIVEHALPTRVIVMTALPLENLKPAIARNNLVAWLAKPVSPQQLQQTLQDALAGQAPGVIRRDLPSQEATLLRSGGKIDT